MHVSERIDARSQIEGKGHARMVQLFIVLNFKQTRSYTNHVEQKDKWIIIRLAKSAQASPSGNTRARGRTQAQLWAEHQPKFLACLGKTLGFQTVHHWRLCI